MNLQVKINIQEATDFNKKWFQKRSQQIFKLLDKKEDFSLNINLINETQMQTLNDKFRHKNQPATILTFVDRDVKETFITPENSYQDLGDIFLCPSQIQKQAKIQYKISTKDLMTRMLIHGILHLLGYTHANKKDTNIMEKKENFLINQLKTFA